MTDIKVETPLSSELTLQDARARYDDIKTTSSRRADEFALSVAPRFGSSQLFYRRLLSDNTDPDIRRRAASSVLQMSDVGAEVDIRIQVKAAKILTKLSGERKSPTITQPSRSNDARDKYSALEKAKEAKLDRRWDDAYKMLARHIEDHPNDTKRRLELGLLAYRSGIWGERASAIHALSNYPHNKKAKEALKAVESFFQAYSDALDFPMDADRRASLSSPGSVFQHALRCYRTSALENREGIIMIAPSLAGGGAERIAATIFQGLTGKGKPIEMTIYEVEGKSGRDPLFYLPMTGLGREDVQILDLSAPLREPFTWLPPNLSRKSQAIYDFLVERRPHTLYLTLDMPNLAGGFAGVLAGVPNIILHCHNQRPPKVYAALGMEGWAAAYRSLLERDEVRMISISDTVAEDYANWIGVDLNRIEVIRNGLDLNPLMKRDRQFLDALRSDLGIPQASLIVGTAFRFEAVKRPDLWIKMARRIFETRKDVHFVLFGEGALLQATRQMCLDLKIEGQVHFPGHVNDLYRRLPLLDVFVLSSRSEGLPNVLLEAQAAGAIPVAFDVGGCGEAMIDGVTGFLVSQQSEDALADAVLRALDDPKWRRAAKVEGRKYVREFFSVGRMVGAFNRLFRDKPIRTSHAAHARARHVTK